MDIKLSPRPFGCLIIILGLMSFWIIPIMIRSRESVFPKRLDDKGILTQSGKSIAWNELKRVKHSRFRLGSTGTVMEAYNFHSARGRISFFSNRIVNFDEAMAYTWSKVPHLAKTV